MKNILFIAWSDAKIQLKQGSTLLWVLVMPPIFFYFIGTVTGGFSAGVSGGQAAPLTVVAESPGFLRDQLTRQLEANDFAPNWVETLEVVEQEEPPRRVLTIGANLTDEVLAGNEVALSYETRSSALSREFEEIRIQRTVYTTLADVVAAEVESPEPLSQTDLDSINNKTRVWQLDVSPAGNRVEIPSGFDQAIPGILVMFTLLVLLTTGGSLLVIERKQGLLRRLASAPISRQEVVSGKWAGRMLLATVQIGAALLFGTYLFKMDWGPNFGVVLIVLAAWAGFCASAGLLLGSIAKNEGQAAGLGVLAANVLAALGGCWWPIEVTPGWMQSLQNFLPTGWTMDALHKLISFQAGPSSVLTEVVLLVVGTVVVAALAVRQFQYQA